MVNIYQHPDARYFNLGKIDDSQLHDLATRKNQLPDEVLKYLKQNYSE